MHVYQFDVDNKNELSSASSDAQLIMHGQAEA